MSVDLADRPQNRQRPFRLFLPFRSFLPYLCPCVVIITSHTQISVDPSGRVAKLLNEKDGKTYHTQQSVFLFSTIIKYY